MKLYTRIVKTGIPEVPDVDTAANDNAEEIVYDDSEFLRNVFFKNVIKNHINLQIQGDVELVESNLRLPQEFLVVVDSGHHPSIDWLLNNLEHHNLKRVDMISSAEEGGTIPAIEGLEDSCKKLSDAMRADTAGVDLLHVNSSVDFNRAAAILLIEIGPEPAVRMWPTFASI